MGLSCVRSPRQARRSKAVLTPDRRCRSPSLLTLGAQRVETGSHQIPDSGWGLRWTLLAPALLASADPVRAMSSALEADLTFNGGGLTPREQ